MPQSRPAKRRCEARLEGVVVARDVLVEGPRETPSARAPGSVRELSGQIVPRRHCTKSSIRCDLSVWIGFADNSEMRQRIEHRSRHHKSFHNGSREKSPLNYRKTISISYRL